VTSKRARARARDTNGGKGYYVALQRGVSFGWALTFGGALHIRACLAPTEYGLKIFAVGKEGGPVA
jgi:hypothetical protein